MLSPAVEAIEDRHDGYRKRTGFLAGLTVAQISEFSLIVIAMGVALGHVSEEALGLVTLVGLITIAVSTYMITWSHQVFRFVEPMLSMFERRDAGTHEANWQPRESRYDVLLFGLGRYGCSVARCLKESGLSVVGVDFNPEVVDRVRREGIEATFGDASDPEFIAHLPLGEIRLAISALPEIDAGIVGGDPRLSLVHALRDAHFSGKIAVAVHSAAAAERAFNVGADIILKP